jgi:hypothetical protein
VYNPKDLVGKHSRADFEQLLDRIEEYAERIVREEAPAPRDPETHESGTVYPWCGGFPTIEACNRRGYCAKDPNCGE